MCKDCEKAVIRKAVAKILITGASGMIGTHLTRFLKEGGRELVFLSRSQKNNSPNTFVWNLEKGVVDERAFDGVDTIVHLAGAGIAEKRWTKKRKKELLDSRVLSTRLLFETLKKIDHQVKCIVSASAIGYYGFHDEDLPLKETDAPGTDFLAGVVKSWEEEAHRFTESGIRLAIMRIGIVLGANGGAFKEIAGPIRFHAGAPLGTGGQHMSWIHIDDVCLMFQKAIDDETMHGLYNVVGPYSVTNRELTNAIAAGMGRRILLPPVPAFLLKFVFGEMADLVLRGSRVSSEKIQQAGYRFRYDTLEKAISALLPKS